MQVANALNNTIRILFNPKVESFKLFDFLIVKSSDDRYLAQITEIYDDKFDASQNVAKLKLFYKIAQNNEVMPYDNFTPNKECEISKVKPEEVENFINNDKKTFIFATNAKTSQGLNIQYDFFNKNAIIMADKVENANAISLNLAKKLSTQKHSVIVDFTGIIEYDDAKKIKACKNFRMPLNYSTIELIFDRCLFDASLEFQATGIEIMNAIIKYAKKQELNFIPFGAFVNVILEQYKATPYPELQLLLARMKKYQMYDIFAKNKKDYETLTKTIEKNGITIIDLSGLDSIWQKSYLEYIVSEIEEEIYLITRINDESFDTDLINKIYNEKENIKFVPNVSYNYSKLPSIMQYCKNYILMPSMNQRNDFLDANFALSNLISEGCIVFGKNTDNFMYLARDYELEVQEKRKNYRKIALSMIDSISGEPVVMNKVSDSQRLIEELSDFEEQSLKEYHIDDTLDEKESEDEFQEIEQIPEAQEVPREIETIKNMQEIKLSNESGGSVIETNETDLVLKENPEEKNTEPEKEVQTIAPEQNNQQEASEKINSNETLEIQKDDTEDNGAITVEKFENTVEESQKEPEINKAPEQEIDISDEELDFFGLAENSAAVANEENVVIDNVEYKTKSDNSENNKNRKDDVDLSELASTSVENNFNEIINSETKNSKQTFQIDENTAIQVDLKDDSTKENLPIFKDEENNSDDDSQKSKNYEVGDTVIHAKYGRGKIIQVMQQDQMQLLRIDFADSGLKLLDPRISEVQLEK